MGKHRRAPEGLLEAGPQAEQAEQSRSRGAWWWGVHSPHRCPDEGKEQTAEASSCCPAQIPGNKVSEH